MHCLDTLDRRRGSLALEAAIALALLTTAMAALAKLSHSAAQLRQQADGRVAARLAGENVLMRLQQVTAEELAEASEAAADSMEQLTGCRIEIEIEPFAAAEQQGQHLKLSIQPRFGQQVVMHDWFFAAAAEPNGNSGNGASESENRDGGEVDDR